MKIKIAYKIISLNLGIIVFLMILFSTFSYFSSRSMFSDALNGIDEDVIEFLAEDLSQYHISHGGWDTLAGSPELWGEIINERFFAVFFARIEEARQRMTEEERLYVDEMAAKSTAPQPKWEFPFGTFLQRSTLLDKNKNVIIAAEITTQDVNYQKIKVQGQVVGWVGVGSINVNALPLANYFYQQQIHIMFWVVIIGGVIASLVSIFLSHQITSPIKKLTVGAKEIAKRNYLSSIDVDSRDELKELANSFNTLSHELYLFEQRQKQWLGDIAHELRTPVAILIAEISAICDNLTKCDIESVSSLKQDVLQIQRLVEDLHELSRLDEEGLSFVKAPFDVIELLKNQIMHFEHKFKNRDITVNFFTEETSAFVIGDSDRVVQVLRNLFDNCAKYTEVGGAVWVSFVQYAEYSELLIEDSGPGVSDESLHRLFDRLYRESPSRSGSGAGLGLAICKKIVLTHGWQIKAERSQHGGLLVRLTMATQ